MNPVTEDIKDLLVAEGYTFTGTDDWAIFIDTEPNKPDKCITLFDTGGPDPLGCMDRSKKKLLRPSFQARVRGNSYKGAHDAMEDINVILDQHVPWTATSEDSAEADVRYQGMQMSGDPIPLGQDDNDRFVWVTSFQTHRNET